MDDWGKSGFHPSRQLGLNKAGSMVQAVKTQLLFSGGTHHGNKDLGVLQIAGNFRSGDRNPANSWVFQLKEYGLAGDLANHLGDAF